MRSGGSGRGVWRGKAANPGIVHRVGLAQPARRRRTGGDAMKVVRGKVVLKDTGAGVPGVVAVVEGIPAPQPNGSVVEGASVAAGHVAAGHGHGLAVAPVAVDVATAPRVALGSQATAADGSFTL